MSASAAGEDGVLGTYSTMFCYNFPLTTRLFYDMVYLGFYNLIQKEVIKWQTNNWKNAPEVDLRELVVIRDRTKLLSLNRVIILNISIMLWQCLIGNNQI